MQQIRGRQRHVKRTRSAAQRKRNNSFRWCCRVWREHATPAVVSAWQTFAVDKETAFNAFMRITLVRKFNDIKIELPLMPPKES